MRFEHRNLVLERLNLVVQVIDMLFIDRALFGSIDKIVGRLDSTKLEHQVAAHSNKQGNADDLRQALPFAVLL